MKPVTLSVSSESDRRAGEVINLSIHAELDKGWHIWGIYNVPEGPIPTTIETVDEKVKKAGQVGEPEPVVAYDEGFETDIPYHEKSVTFTLPVLLEDSINPGQAEIMVSVQYQTCNERICLPPKTVDLMVPITIEAGSPRSYKMTFM
ncbi:MAG: protein-disulfide reductase DsbD family protein [Candidatus Marinimicrobia bacterium]|nr:protein-disulfide reductase DsbD family protein [Candidatus Neomarinimicrobiota bacterium]